MIDTYLINMVFWITVFAVAGAILQMKTKAFGITIGLGGVMYTLLSAVQDAVNAGPTILDYFPFPAAEALIIPSWFISILLFVVSMVVSFTVERSVHQPTF
ncbi:MAG: hypothetical protein ACP5GU_00745 [Thermoprotei archaeon]|jgi:hypothetical protein